MFKTTALAALLAVAAPASMAIASPSRSSDRSLHRSVDGRIASASRIERSYRGHERADARLDRRGAFDDRWRPGTGDDFGPRRFRPTWVALSTSMELAGSGRDTIRISDPSTFTQLRMQVASGAARIDRVIVRFADGSSQVAELDRTLDDRNDLLELPLDGNNRRIDRVTVIGNGDGCGALQLYGI
jgi:hypothetical protein